MPNEAKTSDQHNCKHSQSLMTLGQSLILIKHIMNGNLYAYTADRRHSIRLSSPLQFLISAKFNTLIWLTVTVCIFEWLRITHSFNIPIPYLVFSSIISFNHMNIIHKQNNKIFFATMRNVRTAKTCSYHLILDGGA